MEHVLISGGKRRHKTKVDNCKGCNKEFYHFHWDKQEYCSRECYYIKDKVKSCCEICGKETLKSLSISNRNALNYCSRECYNNRHKGELKKIKRGTKHYDELLENASCDCGVSEIYLLQIHHKDGNNSNNDPDNQEVVCANCHIKRHLKKRKKDGKLVYHPKSLTDIELLKSLNLKTKCMFGDNIKFGDGNTFTPGPGLSMEQGIMLLEDENGNRKIVWGNEYEKQKHSSDLGKQKLNQEDFII